MFIKNLKRKMTMMLACILLFTIASHPTPVSAFVETTSAFTFISVDRTVVSVGQPITFTIRTLGANAVFASTGGDFVHGVRQGLDSPAGQTTWQLTITPTASHTIIIYANTAATLQGAASFTIPITVTAGGGGAIQIGNHVATSPTSVHSIHSITEVRSSSPGTVILRIVTDAASNQVWIRLGVNQNIRASLISTTATQRTWEVSYRPAQQIPHQIQISANHAFVNDRSVVTQSFSVNMSAAHISSGNPFINRLSANPSTIVRGDWTTITVRTNLDVAFVWADVDGRLINARRGSGSATTRAWTIDVRPNRTQNVRVYANTENTTVGADVDVIRISVVDAMPRIDRMYIRNAEIELGQSTVIDVTTNADVEHVWAVVDNRRVRARRVSSSSREREWIIDVSPNRSQTIRVYANAFDDDDGADIFSVRVTVNHPQD